MSKICFYKEEKRGNEKKNEFLNKLFQVSLYFLDQKGALYAVGPGVTWKSPVFEDVSIKMEYVAEDHECISLKDSLDEVNHNILKKHLSRCQQEKNVIQSILHYPQKNGKMKVLQLTSYSAVCTNVRYGVRAYLTLVADISLLQKLNETIDRIEELGLTAKITGSVSHEVRNALSVIKGRLQIMLWTAQLNEANQSSLELLLTEIDAAVEILTELLDVARPSQLNLKRCNLQEVFRGFSQLLDAEAQVNCKEIVYEMASVPDVLLDVKKFRQVVLNLVKNGLQAMDRHGVLYVGTCAENGRVVFYVRDSGRGIPESVLENLGRPFVTTKETGIGLGLMASCRIIDQHHADLQVETGSNGTTFKVVFQAVY